MKRSLNSLMAVFIVSIMMLGTAVSASAASSTDVYNALGIYRNQNGLGTLIPHRELNQIAQSHANRLASADTTEVFNGRLTGPGISRAQLPGSDEGGSIYAAIAGWKSVAGARSIMLGDYTHLGTGIAYGKSGTVYVVANYAKIPPPPPAPSKPLPAQRQAPAPPPAPKPKPRVAPAPKPDSQPAPQTDPEPRIRHTSKPAEPKQSSNPNQSDEREQSSKQEQPEPKESPKPRETKKPEPKETRKPEPKATDTPSPSPTATETPDATPTAVPTNYVDARELKEARVAAKQAREQASAEKQEIQTILTYGAAGFGGLGLLSFATIPFLRYREEDPTDLMVGMDDDNDDGGFFADIT